MFRCCYKNPAKINTQLEIQKICGLCSKEKSIMTLTCKHMICVSCYSKYKYCIQCEKKNLTGVLC